MMPYLMHSRPELSLIESQYKSYKIFMKRVSGLPASKLRSTDGWFPIKNVTCVAGKTCIDLAGSSAVMESIFCNAAAGSSLSIASVLW